MYILFFSLQIPRRESYRHRHDEKTVSFQRPQKPIHTRTHTHKHTRTHNDYTFAGYKRRFVWCSGPLDALTSHNARVDPSLISLSISTFFFTAFFTRTRRQRHHRFVGIFEYRRNRLYTIHALWTYAKDALVHVYMYVTSIFELCAFGHDRGKRAQLYFPYAKTTRFHRKRHCIQFCGKHHGSVANNTVNPISSRYANGPHTSVQTKIRYLITDRARTHGNRDYFYQHRYTEPVLVHAHVPKLHTHSAVQK